MRQLTGRVVLEFDEAILPAAIRERVGSVFGVANYSVARRVLSAIQAMKEAIAEEPPSRAGGLRGPL